VDETGLILEQWVSTYEGSKENFSELLEGVDESSARARPIAGRHTIWEIVNHCTFWLEAAVGAMDSLEMPARVGDWPPVGEGEGEWRADVEGFKRAVDGMIRAVRVFDMGRLHEGVPGEHYPYSFFEMFFRVAHHNIHHGGQIAILRPR
jgi:hypothetical protein